MRKVIGEPERRICLRVVVLVVDIETQWKLEIGKVWTLQGTQGPHSPILE